MVGRAHHAERSLDRLIDQTLKLGVIRMSLGERRVLLIGERALHGNERVRLWLGHTQRLVRDDGSVARAVRAPAGACHGIVARQIVGMNLTRLVLLGIRNGTVLGNRGRAPGAEVRAHRVNGSVGAQNRGGISIFDSLHLRHGSVDLGFVDGLDRHGDITRGSDAIACERGRNGCGVGAAGDVASNDNVVTVYLCYGIIVGRIGKLRRAGTDLARTRQVKVAFDGREVDRLGLVRVVHDLAVNLSQRGFELGLLGSDVLGGLGGYFDRVAARNCSRGRVTVTKGK